MTHKNVIDFPKFRSHGVHGKILIYWSYSTNGQVMIFWLVSFLFVVALGTHTRGSVVAIFDHALTTNKIMRSTGFVTVQKFSCTLNCCFFVVLILHICSWKNCGPLFKSYCWTMEDPSFEILITFQRIAMFLYIPSWLEGNQICEILNGPV